MRYAKIENFLMSSFFAKSCCLVSRINFVICAKSNAFLSFLSLFFFLRTNLVIKDEDGRNVLQD